MLPSVLEVFVLWHPNDPVGARVSEALIEHFHGGSFQALIPGAVEVYPRSAGWHRQAGPPRPMPLPGGEPVDGIVPARYVAVVPVLSLALARAVENEPDWHDYLGRHVADREGVTVIPIATGSGTRGSKLTDLLDEQMRAARDHASSSWRRDLVQALAQFVLGTTTPLQVFISHTRATLEEDERVRELTEMVRHTILRTRLAQFFDASSLQLGQEWRPELMSNASRGAFLAIRTNRYASRAWCQAEMRAAKQAGSPIVLLDALHGVEERGSFLMDHVRRVQVRHQDRAWAEQDVELGLSLLVDEVLQRALWHRQAETGAELALTWWAPQAPEPLTLASWLEGNRDQPWPNATLRVIYPDPPLGQPEQEVLEVLLRLHNPSLSLELLTPRQLVASNPDLDG